MCATLELAARQDKWTSYIRARIAKNFEQTGYPLTPEALMQFADSFELIRRKWWKDPGNHTAFCECGQVGCPGA